jgi:hypothetical protein
VRPFFGKLPQRKFQNLVIVDFTMLETHFV